MNKEHIFPRWLILRTNTNKTGIRWGEQKNLPALKATLPLCVECNNIFGKEFEEPVSKLFEEIESQKGISDLDAELLIRWLWKTEGLAWVAGNPNDKYTWSHSLKERVLNPIDEIREHLVLAISLIENIHPDSDDLPMGIDSITETDAVFVSGVFSKISIMVILEQFIHLLPASFSYYRLAPKRDTFSTAKLFFPKVGFKDDVEAVVVTSLISIVIGKAHDDFWKHSTK